MAQVAVVFCGLLVLVAVVQDLFSDCGCLWPDDCGCLFCFDREDP